jgi:uncharacterized protein
MSHNPTPAPDAQRRITALTRALQARTEEITNLTVQLEEARMEIETLNEEIAALRRQLNSTPTHTAPHTTMSPHAATPHRSGNSNNQPNGTSGTIATALAHTGFAQATSAAAHQALKAQHTRKRPRYRTQECSSSSNSSESDADATATDNDASAPEEDAPPLTLTTEERPRNYNTESYEVRTSSLPNCGLGVYTKHDIPKGTRIMEYTGKRLTHQEYCERYKVNAAGRPTVECLYVAQAGRGVYIDATDRDLANEACLINHVNRSWGLHNCDLKNATVPDPDNAHAKRSAVVVVATRDINAGEELFTQYGTQYWQGMPANIAHRRRKISKLVHELTDAIDKGATTPPHPSQSALFTLLQGIRQQYHERHDRREAAAKARADAAANAPPPPEPTRQQPKRTAHTTPYPAHLTPTPDSASP